MLDKCECTALDSIKIEFDSWAASTEKDIYLYNGIIHIEAKKSERRLMRKRRPCIEINFISVIFSSRGKGICGKALNHIRQHCEENGITLYVENVLSGRLKSFLRKQGYKYKNPYGKSAEKGAIYGVGSFYLLPKTAAMPDQS